MTEQEKWEASRAAQKAGGPCPICNWKDGDGTRTCFYSSQVGIVKHENNESGVLASMNEAQRHLYLTDQVLAYISEDFREKRIAWVDRQHRKAAEKHRALYPDRPFSVSLDGKIMSEDAWIARYRQEEEQSPLASDPRYAGWIAEPWWSHEHDQPPEYEGLVKEDGNIRFTAYMVHLYEPHSCGKGHKYFIAPYHFGCTGCSVELRMWEHGVDYDIG